MFSKFIPDFSTRKEYKKPIPPPPAPAPPRAPEPIALSPPLPPPSVMEFKPVYIKKERNTRRAEPALLSAPTATVPQSGSGYAPDIATTPSLGSSYFATYQDVVANGGAGWSKFPALQNVDISGFNLNAVGTANCTSVSTINAYISSLNSLYGNISTVNTGLIDLDGNLLTTDNGGGGELLLNGVPIATVANISSIADWSLYDAISTVQMHGYDISGTGSLYFDTAGKRAINNLSTINSVEYVPTTLWATKRAVRTVDISGFDLSGVATLRFGANALTTNGANQLTYNGSIITAGGGNVADWAQNRAVTNIDASGFDMNNLSTLRFGANALTTNGANQLTYNGAVINAGGPTPADWANYPAVGNIDISGFDLSGVSTIQFGVNKLTTNPSNQLTYNGTVVNTGSNVSEWSRYSALQTVAMNGQTLNDTRTITGNGANLDINVTGITGQTSLLALKAENGLQGQVNITAGSGDLNNGGGLVNIRAEGGAPALSGLYGHINLTATYGQVGLVSPTYTGGLIELNATSGPGVGATSAIKFSAAGINSYAGAIPSIGSLAGYNFIYGTAGINMVAGLIPPIIPAFPTCVYMYGSAGIQLDSDTYVSNIYPYWSLGTLPAPNLKIAGRTIGVYKSYVDISGASQIAFDPDGNKQLLGAEVITLTDAAQITVDATTGAAGQVLGKDVSNNLRWITPSGGSVPPDLVVSTLTTADTGYISTPTAYVSSIVGLSSINGAVYPPPAGSVPSDLVVSTLTTATTGYISTPTAYVSSIVGLSSINGVAYPPAVSVGSYITLGGASVACTSLGEINAIATAGQDINLNSGNNLRLNSAGGLANAIFMNGGLTVDYTGKVLEFAPQPGTSIIQGQIVGLSTVNGSVYPPPFTGSISSISNGTGFVEVNPAGAIFMTATNGENTTVENIGGSLIVGADDINLNGLQIGPVGQNINFPLGTGSAIVGQISNVSTINGQTPGLVWAAGGTYNNPNVTIPTNTNTLISYQSITTFSTTSKFLIMVQFNGTEVSPGNIYATIGRSALVPTAANTTNLSDRASALTNAISGNGLHMWVESSSSSFNTIICHVVDTPGAIGSFYYSLWIRSATGISTLATELGVITVLQVAP